MSEQEHKNRNKAAGYLFAGLLLSGMAVGMYIHDIRIGLFAGLGAGFIAMAAVFLLKK